MNNVGLNMLKPVRWSALPTMPRNSSLPARNSAMDNFTLVRPEHLNHHGYLFGGVMLKWVDENAWMAASRDYPNCTLVTINMDACHFKHRVENGSILRFAMQRSRQGRTSAAYQVNVFCYFYCLSKYLLD